MDIKNNQPADEKKNKPDNLLKQQINYFLINYFNYSALVLAIIILVVGLFLFVYPQYQKISKNETTAKSSLQAEYETKSAYLLKISNLKKTYQSISAEDRKKIEDMVPVDSNVVKLIPEIEAIVLRNSAVLNSINIVSEDSKSQLKAEAGGKQTSPAGIFNGQLPGGVKLIKIEINLSSVDYQVLKNIIKSFENNLRLLDISRIDYSVKDSKTVLIIYSYYLPG